MDAQRLHRPVQYDLPAVDVEAPRRNDLRDVARGHRSIELTGVTGLPDGGERLARELSRNAFCVLLQRKVAGLELDTIRFKAGDVFLGCAQRLLLREEKIAGKAVLDVHYVSHLAKAADAFEQDDLHETLR